MPTRTCVGCRRTDDQAAMRRMAATPDGPVVSRTAPGRGAWLHPGCGAAALKRRALPRALRLKSSDGVRLAELVQAVDAEAVDLVKPPSRP